MRSHKRLLISLAAFVAAGLTGCLNSPDSTASLSAPVTEAEIQAALKADSLHPAPPPRPIVCDTLKARLAALDTTASQYAGFSHAVARVCAVHPDSGKVRPPRPDSLRPDSARPKPDSLRPVPPVKPDSLRPDSTRPKPDSVPPVRSDSGKAPRPLPPQSARPDSLPSSRPDSLPPLPPKSGKPDSVPARPAK